MTLGEASVLTAAFIGVFALGVAVGPLVKDKFSDGNNRAAAEPAVAAATPAPATATPPARAPRARERSTNRKAAAASTVTSAVPASEPRLHDRLRPVLNRGA